MRLKSLILALVVVPTFMVVQAFAQSTDDATRRLWDTAFIKSSKSHAQTKRKKSYRITTPSIPITNVVGETVVGVTVWRLRRPTAAESGERIIVHEGEGEVEWLPERISANTKLAPGDRLRISVEAARTGYLYVIDREQYADGSMGDPYLIFPTKRTLNGDNSVKVGKLIEIPAQDDAPPYFRVRRSRPDQVAEVLSVFVTPTPLEGVEIAEKMQKLTGEQLTAWEKKWSTQVGSIELENGAGQAWTKEEKQAASNSQVLNSAAPAPQVVYYRPQAKPGEPMLVKVQLKYRPATKTNP